MGASPMLGENCNNNDDCCRLLHDVDDFYDYDCDGHHYKLSFCVSAYVLCSA
jgi:hypothetical protein